MTFHWILLWINRTNPAPLTGLNPLRFGRFLGLKPQAVYLCRSAAKTTWIASFSIDSVPGRAPPAVSRYGTWRGSAPAQAGGLLRMRVSYKVRFNQSPWPRVMLNVGHPTYQSVHRGKPGCELRSEISSLRWPTLLCQGEGNRRKRRVRCRLRGVQDHRHGWKQSSRKLGDPEFV